MQHLRKRVQIQFDEVSRTKQAHKDECDVNKILKRYQQTQQLSHVNQVKGQYGDFSNVTDFQSSLNSVMEAEQNFMGLPAHIRKKFGNDPSALIHFLSDDKNYDHALELGLLDQEKADTYLRQKAEKLEKEKQKLETKQQAASKTTT